MNDLCIEKTTSSLDNSVLIGDGSCTEREDVKASLAYSDRLVEGELEDRNVFVRALAAQ